MFKSSDRHFVISFVIFSIYCFVPFFRSFSVIYFQMPMIITSYLLLLVSINNRLGKEMVIKTLLLSFVIIVLNFFLFYLQDDHTDFTIVNMIGAHYTLFVTMYPIIILSSMGLKKVDKNALYNFIIFICIITSISTIIGAYSFETPTRELATPFNPVLDNFYQSLNIGGYGFVYSMVLLIPFIFKKFMRKKSIINISILLLFLFMIVKSEYTIAIILTAITLLLSLIINLKKATSKILIILVVFLIIINLEYIIQIGIDYFSTFSGSVSSRLSFILDILKSRGNNSSFNELNLRFDLYRISVDTFVKSPFFGRMFDHRMQLSGHSESLDFIAHSGIFGISIFIGITMYIKSKLNCFPNKENSTKVMYFIAILLSTINTFLAPEFMFMMLLMPIIYNEKGISKEINKS
ncbi:hypothetical protein [Acholeplasma laidlawii]|uniref:hypothetical protein n=1 Tax=Acholeplasma laidlawii TaxID=2148 RepID=UPI0021F6F1E6|nr:hypothetical protein [Acholeplasma laidlawii]